VSPKASAKDALDFFIKEYPGIGTLLGNDYSLIEKRAGGIPITGPKSIDEMVADGLILAGDAAGTVDPITGEGIIPSMLSGMAAGEVAALCIRGGSWDKKALSVYDETWRTKQYMGCVPLGEDLDMITESRDLFLTAFSRKDIPNEAREILISALSMEVEEDVSNSLEKVRRMVGR